VPVISRFASPRVASTTDAPCPRLRLCARPRVGTRLLPTDAAIALALGPRLCASQPKGAAAEPRGSLSICCAEPNRSSSWTVVGKGPFTAHPHTSSRLDAFLSVARPSTVRPAQLTGTTRLNRAAAGSNRRSTLLSSPFGSSAPEAPRSWWGMHTPAGCIQSSRKVSTN
jgi:hypothetical protein